MKYKNNYTLLKNSTLKIKNNTISREQDKITDIIFNIVAEQNLWKAVIMQAVLDLQSQSKKKIMHSQKIRSILWFKESNENFINVCDFANLEPSYLLKKIEYHRNQAINEIYNRNTKQSNQPTYKKNSSQYIIKNINYNNQSKVVENE